MKMSLFVDGMIVRRKILRNLQNTLRMSKSAQQGGRIENEYASQSHFCILAMNI